MLTDWRSAVGRRLPGRRGPSAAGGPSGALSGSRLGPLGVAVLLGGLAAGCASTGAVPRPFPVPRESSGGDAGRSAGRAAASEALALRGTPYRTAGADPSGFDCSGLVQYVFTRQGVAVPRSVTAQFRIGRDVEPDRVEAGDLVFFRIGARDVSHVGIALGDGRFVHAPSERGSVRVEALDAPYWARRYAGARRIGAD